MTLWSGAIIISVSVLSVRPGLQNLRGVDALGFVIANEYPDVYFKRNLTSCPSGVLVPDPRRKVEDNSFVANSN